MMSLLSFSFSEWLKGRRRTATFTDVDAAGASMAARGKKKTKGGVQRGRSRESELQIDLCLFQFLKIPKNKAREQSHLQYTKAVQ